MKIALGSDHAGFPLKQHLVDSLRRSGHQVTDVGTNSSESVDYPDYAAEVGKAVAAGDADYGILVCGSGVGMSIAANKIPGIRAVLGVQAEQVRLSRAHNNANVLALGNWVTAPPAAEQFVELFLNTEFEGGRHARRVAKIDALAQPGSAESHKVE